MTIIKFIHYNDLKEMTPETFRVVRTMGYIEGGHLRDICITNQYKLKHCILCTVDDKIVGWAAYYREQISTSRFYNKNWIGFWVQCRHRKNGYGKKLIKELHSYLKANKKHKRLLFGATWIESYWKTLKND